MRPCDRGGFVDAGVFVIDAGKGPNDPPRPVGQREDECLTFRLVIRERSEQGTSPRWLLSAQLHFGVDPTLLNRWPQRGLAGGQYAITGAHRTHLSMVCIKILRG